MAFDSATRNKLAKIVAGARTLLSKEFTGQLQEIYGIQPDGTLIKMEKLTHLNDEEQAIATMLRDRVNHLANNMAAEKKPLVAAIDRMIREQAFTLLNRFAALRMCEERKLIQESIGSGIQSKGFKVYLQIAGSGLGDTYARYKTYLLCLFDEIAIDLGVIFDRYSPLGLLFPREDALLALLELLDDEDLQHLWAEDETIGWIYQYFNSQEERKQMRDASAAPRNSRELAVRNQFFTPRYVVEFLTDNTLGRIWYEMTQGETTLKDKSHYFVRRPNEIFLSEGEDTPEEEQSTEDLTQEELLQQTVYIPFRQLKDPRQIRMLDPACGSMHFGLYAFDLYERIYEEAWEIEEQYGAVHFERDEKLQPLHDCYGDKKVFLTDIPRLIIEHNIHGVDIDPRAVQIAGLSLWLRAQRNWRQKGIKQDARPTITRSNIVCAEPMPGDKDMLAEFTENLEPRVLGQLVEIVFDKMQLAGEAGSLLKIEEEIADAVEEARQAFNKEMQARKNGADYLPGMAPQKRQTSLFDFTDLTDETEFWGRAEEMIINALQGYAGQVQDGSTNQRSLFAKDAARGFAFIDLCRKRYDVILMNPPFGEASFNIATYLAKNHPTWSKNILCSFIERARQICTESGKVGAIFDRTASIKSSYEKFRRSSVVPFIELVADTGWHVLDANVETTTHVWSIKPAERKACFLDLREVEGQMKGDILLIYIQGIAQGNKNDSIYFEHQNTLLRLPNSVIGYYFPHFLIKAFSESDSIVESGMQARKGNDYVADQHVRLFWEINECEMLDRDGIFRSLYNGGKFSLFVAPLRNVVAFGKDGSLVREHKSVTFRNIRYHFLAGVGYGKRGDIIDAHILPKGFTFTSEGLAITGISSEIALFSLGFLNSSFAQFALSTYSGQHKQVGYVNLLPLPKCNASVVDEITENVKDITTCLLEWQNFDETTRRFFSPWLSGKWSSIAKCKSAFLAALERANQKFIHQVKLNDNWFARMQLSGNEEIPTELVATALKRPESSVWPELSEDFSIEQYSNFLAEDLCSIAIGVVFGRWDIHCATGKIQQSELSDPYEPLPLSPPALLQNVDGLPAEPEDVRTDYPLRISWSGILVDDKNYMSKEGNCEDIVSRIEDTLKIIWEDKWESIEQEACEILDVKTLRDYFNKPAKFFAYHLKRYSKNRRKAPIYWPLSTDSGSYTLWLYYHRLTDQTLFTCVTEFLDPKIKDVTADIAALKEKVQQESSTENRRKLDKLLGLEIELKDFREELLRIANLPYKPNLNDGVMITAAPLWKLFRHRQWSKELQKCWQKLENGDYDWAHLAYSIWPERVIPQCHKDRSLAIAHDLEEELWDEVKNGTDRQGNPKYKWKPKKLSREDIQLLIREKTGK